ncbi:hypothetical protein SAMN05421690_10083 [Nitrosomonas sp. Nm51]|uniref:hypothetical protein n=1 Tax=Nitrosomonas sp. Nm51 TaxID=133720 RepID=UPI0008BAEFD3|nr:hypothetical protein [Nitrosomonas sp. Nm51]SER08282.1 hypothetical protein SAMN05421690_10083 [Nitrosomonas sp. Nm51]
MKTLTLFFFLLIIASAAAAQGIESESTEKNGAAELEDLAFDRVFDKIILEESTPAAGTPDSVNSIRHVRVVNEFYYVIILSVMCLLSLSIVLYFLLKLKKDAQPNDIVSGAGLILIVFGTIILVLIVDTSEQLTAAIGILGAIAGYLFRTAQENGQPSQPNVKTTVEK